MMDKRVIFLVVYVVVCNVQADDHPIVNTAIGTIRGVRSDDGQYDMFMGIPYAKVNESNPFGKSIPHPNFEEIFEANDESSECPHINSLTRTVVGELDCLRLNIYTPTNVNSNSRLPVFVWIFGGKFTKGSYGRYMYGPKFLVRDDVIVVTMNYRLGIYGFMCLDIPEVPGNQGMKDQITALRWIKAHIRAFGGDPDQVTLGGSSSGAMSVDFHLHRDNTEEKLFHKVILQSGTSLAPLFNKPLRNAPIIISKCFDFYADDIYAALDFLATVPPHDLIRAQDFVFQAAFYTSGLWASYTRRAYNALRVQYNNAFRVLMGLPRFCSASGMFAELRVDCFYTTMRAQELLGAEELAEITIDGVCVEKSFDGVESYLTTNWVLKKSIPAIDSMKVLIGVTDDEKGILRNDSRARTMSDPLTMRFNTQHKDFEGMRELVHKFYMGDEIFGADAFDSVVNLTSDLSFVHPTYRTIYKYIENNVGDIYFYNFSYVGDRNCKRRWLGIDVGIGGAYHADELGYVFDMEFIPEIPTADDQLVIDKMTKMWTNFVKYGDPTPELTELIDVKWEPIRRHSPIYSMNINNQLSLETGPIADKITFWDVFYEKNGHLQWVLQLL